MELPGGLIASSWVFASTIVFFPAFSMYAWNARYFNIRTSVLVAFLLIFTTGVALASAFVLSAFPKCEQMFIAIQMALSTAVLLQGALPFEYQIFTGLAPALGKPVYGLIDASIWVIVFVWALFSREWISNNVLTVSTYFIVAQLSINFAFPILANWAPLAFGEGAAVINARQLYSYSSENNIVVFIIDSLQSTVMAEALKDDPELSGHFDGFTLYKDTLAMYNATALAIPGFLSGEYYLNKETVRDFTKKSFLSASSLLGMARDEGREVSLESFESFPGIAKKSSLKHFLDISEYLSRGLRSQCIFEFSLLDLAVFKIMPHYLKIFIFDEKSRIKICNTMMQNKDFIERFERRFNTDSPRPTFHVYHIPGVHIPMVLQEGSERRVLTNTFPNYKRYCTVLFRNFVRILNRMKESGIYDRTTVVIMGDHGIPIGDTDSLPAPHLQPAIAVKPRSSRGPLSFGVKQISLADLKNAVADDLSQEDPIGDYFQRVPEGPRHRNVYVFDSSRRTDVAILPMLGYVVRGDVRERSSWTFIGSFDVVGPSAPQRCRVALAEKVLVSEFEEASPLGIRLTGDWALVERGGVWTTGKVAGMKIPLPSDYSGGDLRLQFEGFAYVNSRIFQRVNVQAHGIPVASWILAADSPAIPAIWIPGEILGEEKCLTAEFFIQDPVSPFQLGVDLLDHRRLGLFLQAVTLSHSPPFESGMVIQARDMHGRIGLVSGWGKVEEKGIWSDGGESLLRVPLVRERGVDLEVCLEGFAYCPSGHSQRVEVHANGIRHRTWVLPPCDSTLPRIQIPKDLTIGSSTLELRFVMPDTKSPSELDLDPGDHRKLGIFLQSIAWRER